MKSVMTSKERIQTTLSHQIPDRVPMALWGSYYTLNDDTYFNVLKHCGLTEPVLPFRKLKPRNSNYYDDRILDFLDTDVRFIWSGFTDLGGARMNGDRKDAWGVEWVRSGPNITSIGAPLKNMTLEQIAEYSWPDPEQYLDYKLMEERIDFLIRNYPDKAIAARAVNSYGPFEQASELRGREDFLMDMIIEPDIANLIVEKCTEVIIRAQEIYLDIVGTYIDYFEIPGDDYGSNQSLLISPKIFNEMFQPQLRKIVGSIKQYRQDLPVAFHSDGAITNIIGDLIDCGIDILNPLEPLPATDWKEIKDEYGDNLCFMGGVDLKEALTGSVEDVEIDVQRCLDTFAEGGGYILTSANHMPPDIPPENVIALFESGKRLGVYS